MRISPLATLFLLLLVGHVLAAAQWLRSNNREMHRLRSFQDETLKVRPGAGLSEVLQDLHRRKLMPHPLYTRVLLQIRLPELVLKRGSYRLPEQGSCWDLLLMLHKGQVFQWAITIPEGLDKWETAALLGSSRWGNEAAFLALIENPAPILDLDPFARDLEGYLWPETYYFEDETTPGDIVQAMVRLFRRKAKHQRERLAQLGLSVREWATLASLIEKETSRPEERFLISGVFHRRLEKGMLLQCDPTIIYALKLDQRYRGRIHSSEIRYPHPYNTYVYSGLPPGPIASAGWASLEAALHPESHDYLYFVARKDGTHQFSTTLAEHNRAVRQYQR
jgi:UPF0755 protein